MNIRRMTLAGARLMDRTVDVLGGDYHGQIKNRNNWSWVEVEELHMGPAYGMMADGHPKTPWFAGAWREKTNFFLHDFKQRESLMRRIARGSLPPQPGFGKRAVEARKERAKQKAKQQGDASGTGKKKKK
eukprot:TRINITY_DN18337_c0_g1_i1.p2 TRINITY_DN18337_c0_g1~~TRINITY_DN18337_c0_g1_i1.p2  ORF type:complete len:130 (+),score=24.98 TRINITY_DN18337_c0_g1_i1:60-449(+)